MEALRKTEATHGHTHPGENRSVKAWLIAKLKSEVEISRTIENLDLISIESVMVGNFYHAIFKKQSYSYKACLHHCSN